MYYFGAVYVCLSLLPSFPLDYCTIYLLELVEINAYKCLPVFFSLQQLKYSTLNRKR